MASVAGERLGVVTSVDLRHKMDALVSDLSHALDESQQLPQYHRKRRGFKRRVVKLPNSLGVGAAGRVLSEDSSSSVGEVLLSQDNKSSIPLSDSDDLSPPPSPPRHRATTLPPHLHRTPTAATNLVESDSVNENFSPTRPHNRRKRKCKRLALDPDLPCPSNSQGLNQLPSTPLLAATKPSVATASPLLPSTAASSSTGRKKKVLRPSPDSENSRYLAISAGKRKRGRERSVEWCSNHNHHHHHHHHHHRRYPASSTTLSPLHLRPHHSRSAPHAPTTTTSAASQDTMDYDYSDDPNMEQSSSESSSGSETGIYTCDEGREADDEQSDWFAEPDHHLQGASHHLHPQSARHHLHHHPCATTATRLAWWNDTELELSPTTKKTDMCKYLCLPSPSQALFKERYETMSVENQQACRLRFQKLRERLLRREIRAGRRRLRDRKPGFSIVSSVNDKVSRFLQDPRRSELRLRPMSDKDHDQLRHLANLYSLSLHSSDDHSAAPILTKTRNTITKQELEAEEEGGGPLEGGSAPFPGGLPVPLSDLKRRRRTPPPPPPSTQLTEGSNDSLEGASANLPGASSSRPPVPSVSWEDDVGDCCADSLSERLADSEPDPLPSPTSLGLHDCTL